MNMNKKIRSDWKRMKWRVNRRLKRKYLCEVRESRSVFDQLSVEKSNTNKECLEKEIEGLKLKLKEGFKNNFEFFFSVFVFKSNL